MLEALKITEETFERYLQQPTRKDEDHLDFAAAKDHYIVRDPVDRLNWKCVSKKHFDELYEFAARERVLRISDHLSTKNDLEPLARALGFALFTWVIVRSLNRKKNHNDNDRYSTL